MRFAYADPPYLGCAKRLYGNLHPDASDYDKPETHRALIERLVAEFPDGWGMSLNSTTLRTILPMCPESTRVMAWVKPWTPWKPGTRVAYAWEPLLINGGRKRPPNVGTVRDWCRSSSVMNGPKGFRGCKPEAFCFWMFDVLGAEVGDSLDDLFPGSGMVGRAWADYFSMKRLWEERKHSQTKLFVPSRQGGQP